MQVEPEGVFFKHIHGGLLGNGLGALSAIAETITVCARDNGVGAILFQC